MLLPLSQLETKFQKTVFSVGDFHLGISSESKTDVFNDIIKYLSDRHGDYFEYRFYSPLSELEDNTYSTKVDINSINKIGILMLVTLLVASISIFRMLLGKRERELGICQACGASMGFVMAEVIVEVFTVCLIGTMLGCLGGFFLTYNFTSFLTGTVQMTGHWQTVVISIIVCIAITFVVCIATIQKFYSKNIIELIHNKS